MNKILLTSTVILGLAFSAKAQKGNNQIQISAQAAIPLFDLSDVANTGFGIAGKGMYGFGEVKQQATLEIGYNRFGLKGVPSEMSAHYAAVPIYAGYRYTLGKFNLEPQVGFSVNKIGVSVDGQSVSVSSTSFAWAAGVSYNISKLELGLKYQSSALKDADADLNFVGIRLGYNFSL
ncbi:outer membrane beta-barrel protein [Pedobacter gandavensis]|uniref:outer membrane beta-barrel protein n=1 Tax=Pedobacter gandavensis TaxID=2679963 RepID=UPI00292CFF0A|nr:outer membrane beta-barrel protein [Pedobacter gandavensis]